MSTNRFNLQYLAGGYSHHNFLVDSLMSFYVYSLFRQSHKELITLFTFYFQIVKKLINIYILEKSETVFFFKLFLIYFFRPFIEIYLLHFLKFNFYFLINLISISTIYIVFRIYGYSRLYLLIYLLLSSLILYKSESI